MFLCGNKWHLKYMSGGAARVSVGISLKMQPAQIAAVNAVSTNEIQSYVKDQPWFLTREGWAYQVAGGH